jgi:FG-GAP repeat
MTGSGNSTAQFLDGLEYSTGTGPAAIAVGDLNQDGWQDLVTANSTDNTVSAFF